MSIPAVVLVGGEGTRLRPLTERVPKPMLPLLDRPLLSYTFDHLRSGGVGHTVLACGYLPTEIESFFGDRYDGMTLEYSFGMETFPEEDPRQPRVLPRVPEWSDAWGSTPEPRFGKVGVL